MAQSKDGFKKKRKDLAHILHEQHKFDSTVGWSDVPFCVSGRVKADQEGSTLGHEPIVITLHEPIVITLHQPIVITLHVGLSIVCTMH